MWVGVFINSQFHHSEFGFTWGGIALDFTFPFLCGINASGGGMGNSPETLVEIGLFVRDTWIMRFWIQSPSGNLLTDTLVFA